MSTAPGILLKGPDGGNPLGFLAALGTFRLTVQRWPDRDVSLGWRRWATGWYPSLSIEPPVSEDELVERLHDSCRFTEGGTPDEVFPWFSFDTDTSKIEPDRFRAIASRAADQGSPTDRVFADFLVSFGCEACVSDGHVEDTAFRTMSGSGHQHFLGTMLNLCEKVEVHHIRSALFERWHYADPIQSLSMRWDPLDDRRYALRWDNPSSDPTRKRRGSVLGANRLAIEALPLFPVMPILRTAGLPHSATTGFETGKSEPGWAWPIWSEAISLGVCRSLLANPLVQALNASSPKKQKEDQARGRLKRMGVEAIFRCRRISVDYYRNFTPARSV